MATKRSHEDVEVDGVSHDTSNQGGSSAKKPKFNGTGKKHKAHEGSVEHAKKRSRTIERLFQRDSDLPSEVRRDLETELASLKYTIEKKGFQKRRSAMISKYHMVRFFERKKASRLVKQLQKRVAGTEDPTELAKLQHDLHLAQVDEAYTQHHPHAEPYISLYRSRPGKEDAEDTPIAKAALENQRPPMWSVVESAMEAGPDALNRLRERQTPEDDPLARRMERHSKPSAQKAAPTRTAKKPEPKVPDRARAKEESELNRRQRRELMHKRKMEEAENDGEGFFDL